VNPQAAAGSVRSLELMILALIHRQGEWRKKVDNHLDSHVYLSAAKAADMREEFAIPENADCFAAVKAVLDPFGEYLGPHQRHLLTVQAYAREQQAVRDARVGINRH